MVDFALLRHNMIENQIRPNRVSDERVMDALGSVAKEEFVAPNFKGVAYADTALPALVGRKVPEPLALARLLQAAEIKSHDMILEISGDGGYTAGVLSKLSAAVVSVEENGAEIDGINARLVKIGSDNVTVVEGSFKNGCPEQGPYDVIFLAGSLPLIPPSLLDQLNDGGRLVGVLGNGGMGRAVVAKKEGGKFGQKILFDAALPLLPGFGEIKPFAL